MPIKSILVVVSGGAADATCLSQACLMAKSQNADLRALHVKPSPILDLASSFEMAPTVIEDLQRYYGEVAARLEGECRAAAKATGVPFDWQCVEGDASDIAAFYARYADLAICSPELARNLVFAAGAPVLAMAETMEPRAIRRILVAWNGSREAARALRDAMPLIEAAEQVEILVVDPPKGLPISHEVARLLVRRGIKIRMNERATDGAEVGAVIVEEAGLDGFDLLVMGAYGHWRWKEQVLGGVTEDALENRRIPVLFAH